MTEGSVLIRINLIDSYAASTTIKINSLTITEEVCSLLAIKLNHLEQENHFQSLICVISGYDGKNHLNWLKTLQKNDKVLEFQSIFLKKRIMRIKNQDLINSLTISWYYKDIRSIPLQLEGETSGNSSDEEESEISLNDLIYFGTGDKRAMLLKRSNSDPNLWRKRLCILNDKLWCINLRKKSPYASCIELNGKVMLQEEAPDLNYPYGIIIQNPNQNTYFFRTNNSSEQQIWKDELLDRTAFGIENSVLYMGEMIICDEEYARGCKKNKITRNTLQRQLVWKHLKDIQQLESLEFIKICEGEKNEGNDEIDEQGMIHLSTQNEKNNEIKPLQYQSFLQSQASESLISNSPNTISLELIDDNNNQNFNNQNNESIDNSNNKSVELNADQSFRNRTTRQRTEAYFKYRSSNTNLFPEFKNQLETKKIIRGGSLNDLSTASISASTSTTLTLLSTQPPLPNSSSTTTPSPPPNSRRRSITESYSISSSVIDINPIPLSSLPNSPIQLLHSFHCYSPHITSAISLLDSIHDYKSAFRHDLYITPSHLWSVALEIYHTSLSQFILLITSYQRNSAWNVIKDNLQLNIQNSASSLISSTSSKSETFIEQLEEEEKQIINELTEKEREIYQIIERIKHYFVSNLQKEIKFEKKSPIKKKTQSPGSYWFWPSIEPAEVEIQTEKIEEKKNSSSSSSIAVGYGYQLIDSSIRPPITLFDELIPEHILTNPEEDEEEEEIYNYKMSSSPNLKSNNNNNISSYSNI